MRLFVLFKPRYTLLIMNRQIITRFAPSPTGPFHVGGVRTALFSYLFARHHGGKFLLRIEDTDIARSKKEFETDIIESLQWLGLEWDEYSRQSDRTALYKEQLEKLIAAGAAYVSKEEIKKEGDRPEVIRLKNPGQNITFHDEIRGDISFDTAPLGDFIIARSLTEPLYHFSVVVDDFLGGVTHVIRGEDHISNTSRQILIQEALGAPRPAYAHLPLILAADRSKLSKRKHGDRVSLRYYIHEGYLRDAIVNYMALLGWNPNQGDRELFSLAELIQLFDLTKIQKAGAIFNEEKLRWFNQQYLKTLPTDALATEIKEILIKKYPADSVEKMLPKIFPVILERMSVISDVQKMVADGELEYYFQTPVLDPAKINWKLTPAEKTKAHFQHIRSLLVAIDSTVFGSETLKMAIWPYAEAEGRGEVLWSMRYALSGRERSPDPFLLASILGKEETLKRLVTAETLL